MMIRDSDPDLDEPKTLKVTVPTRLHLQLHQLKILAGQNISQTVESALEEYFAQYRNEVEGNQGQDRDQEAGLA